MYKEFVIFTVAVAMSCGHALDVYNMYQFTTEANALSFTALVLSTLINMTGNQKIKLHLISCVPIIHLFMNGVGLGFVFALVQFVYYYQLHVHNNGLVRYMICRALEELVSRGFTEALVDRFETLDAYITSLMSTTSEWSFSSICSGLTTGAEQVRKIEDGTSVLIRLVEIVQSKYMINVIWCIKLLLISKILYYSVNQDLLTMICIVGYGATNQVWNKTSPVHVQLILLCNKYSEKLVQINRTCSTAHTTVSIVKLSLVFVRLESLFCTK